jgi:hypothetical protein
MSFATEAATRTFSVNTTRRWFYAGMAALFVVTSVLGFAPTSIAKIHAVQIGQRPPLPAILHLHAVAMGTWLLLLMAQSVLPVIGRVTLHRVLGLTSFVVAPTVLLALILLVRQEYLLGASYGFRDEVSNGLLYKAKSIALFAGFYVWAIHARRRDSETHKRLMLLATLAIMDAALGRMVGYGWLPSLPQSFFVGYDSTHAYQLLWLTPALAFDTLTRGRPHRAYVIGVAFFLLFMVITHALWSNPWWLATAPRLIGV